MAPLYGKQVKSVWLRQNDVTSFWCNDVSSLHYESTELRCASKSETIVVSSTFDWSWNYNSESLKRNIFILAKFLPSTAHGVDRYCCRPMHLAIHESMCSAIRLAVCPERFQLLARNLTTFPSNSLRVSAIGLTSGEVMLSTIKQVAVWNDHT